MSDFVADLKYFVSFQTWSWTPVQKWPQSEHIYIYEML